MNKYERKDRGKSSVRRSAATSFVTDGVLIDVYNALARDFQRVKNVGVIKRISSIREYRDIKHPPLSDVLDVDAYKCIYQLRTFFSRYTASQDVYTNQDRLRMSMQKYEENLILINTAKDTSHAYLRPVIGLARKKIREILGRVQLDEVFGASRFGRRASIGVPFRDSYLDNKMVHSMSRSPGGASALFDLALKSDPMLKSYLIFQKKVEKKSLGKRAKRVQHAEELRLSFVAKKFDKLRGVMPYPTADTFLSLGIGDVIVKRLKEIGLDLARAQSKHRRLVRRMSLDRRSVTMDLSGASDSITRWLVRLLLPCDWWNLLKKFSFRKVILPDGRVVHTETFAGMGCGFTFPLQTLIFYSLISAIKELVPATGEVSVYGDDCIFPTMMFPYVERVFEDLGLRINRDKTFVARYFRESCGEDCYRGTSVRPFQPEGSTVELAGSNGSAYLYKILNGLLGRWNLRDIPNTVEVLLRRIAIRNGSVLLVPPFQPDTAGYKVDDPDIPIDWYIPAEPPVVVYPHGTRGLPKWATQSKGWLEPLYHYHAIRSCPDRRFVTASYPFLWESLRASNARQETRWNPYEDVNDDPRILGYAIADPAVPEEEKKFEPYVAL